MDHLWESSDPQTVRQVHEALATHRELAYTTVMTVLQRLAKKKLPAQDMSMVFNWQPGAPRAQAVVPSVASLTAVALGCEQEAHEHASMQATSKAAAPTRLNKATANTDSAGSPQSECGQ